MNGQNSTNIAKPISPDIQDGTKIQPVRTTLIRSAESKQKEPTNNQGFPPPMQQTAFYQSPSSQVCETQPMMQQRGQTSIFQQPSQQMQQMVPQMQMQPMMPQNTMQPRTSIMSSGCGVVDSTLSDIDFTQGFLQTQIGRHVKVEFLIGTNMFVDREGDLVRVGTDYIIIQETETDDYLLCDIYSIKFIRFYY
ncbi:MAG TPA: hypothetical protein VFD00_10395 [Thermoclostridium sp.]|nr:hypothetical protein [Thermoclostridium sp.]